MTTAAPLSARADRLDSQDVHTLAEEHSRLLRDVLRRVAPVQALLDARAWPHAELGALTVLLRTAVLRQVSDEEVHLYPHDASAPPFARLSADHRRLQGLATQLERVHGDPCSRPQLRALLEELVATLRRHLEDEQAALAALTGAHVEPPSVADLTAAGREWLADDAPVQLRLENLPADHAVELSIERVLRLEPGQRAEVHTGPDPDARGVQALQAICRWLGDFDRTRFGFVQERDEQGVVLRVTRRRDDVPTGIGYPG